MHDPEEDASPQAYLCVGCDQPVPPSDRTPLCDTCRQQFVKYPIPLWLKGFGVVLLCVVVFSLATLSKNIQTGIAYKRGVKAMEQQHYITAEKELMHVLAEEPDYLDARCQLLIASFYNSHLGVCFSTSEILQGKEIEDADLLQSMESALATALTYLPKDSFYTVLNEYGNEMDSIPPAVYRSYLSTYPEDMFAMFRLAGVLSDADRYTEADSVLNAILKHNPSYFPALLSKVSVKRELLQIDSSYLYVNRILQTNKQNVLALSSKVRTLLKEKKDTEAITLAKEVITLDPSESHALASLAMAYHFSNETRKRDEAVQKLAADSTAAGALSYVQNIFNGKETFRN
jgi:tetratricopeptide (TPR) repeat protein